MVEKEAKALQAGPETLSINLPPISEERYNYLTTRLGLDSPLNTTREPDEETWKKELLTVSGRLEELAKNIFPEEVFSEERISGKRVLLPFKSDNPFLQTIVPTIDDHLNNNRFLAGAVLFGMGLVMEAYDKDYAVISKLPTLSPPSLIKTNGIVENVLPKRESEHQYQTSLYKVPEIPEDNIYLKKLLEQIAGISRNQNGEYRISDPLVIPPIEFYAGARIMYEILQDNWSQLQETHKSSPHAIPLLVPKDPN